jgi:uncharacterized Fe-S cluster-containing radical SAM superfamily protein
MDPILRAKEVGRIVCKNSRRKYYRFRATRFYGGISTADCVGCNLLCKFCWAWNIVTKPDRVGKFYSPKEVVQKLTGIADKNGFTRLRVSGNEPTICRGHLIELLGLVPEKYQFILETNGLLIGRYPGYAKELAGFPNLHVRVSLKGTNAGEFAGLTGAEPEAFELQLKALENLKKAGVQCHAAIIELAKADLDGLRKRLAGVSPSLADVEVEPLILYPAVKKRLEKAGAVTS